MKKKQLFFFGIIILATLLSVWKIGQHDLQEWDESRNGVNAFEMLQTGDYVNYYYNQQLDTWNAKPPLMIWAIAGSYKIFGYNEFALRFPAVISAIFFFVFCFKLIELLTDSYHAFLTCFVLLSSKAILGNHIGLTGDFDAMLIMLLTASAYFFILYFEKQKKYAIYLVAVFMGLAFYTKGTAAFIFIPGFILYLLFRKKGFNWLKDVKLWISAFIFFLIISSWPMLIYLFGKSSANSFYGSGNSIETMLIHDTFRRLTSQNFGQDQSVDYFFFFTSIDARLNLWNYLFYVGLAVGIFHFLRKKQMVKNYFQSDSHRMVLLSVCLILPLSVVLTFAANKYDWYLAPVFMFIAFIIVKTMLFLGKKWKPLSVVFLLLLAFTFVRHVIYIHNQPQSIHETLSSNESLRNKNIIVTENVRQNIFLYLSWLNTTLYCEENLTKLPQHQNQIVLLRNTQINENILGMIEPIQYFEKYCLAKIK